MSILLFSIREPTPHGSRNPKLLHYRFLRSESVTGAGDRFKSPPLGGDVQVRAARFAGPAVGHRMLQRRIPLSHAKAWLESPWRRISFKAAQSLWAKYS